MSVADRATIGNMGPRARRDLRVLPRRRQDARLSLPDGPRGRPHRARRGVLQGAGHVARDGRGEGFHRHAHARHGRRRALHGRPQSAPSIVCPCPTSRRASPRRWSRSTARRAISTCSFRSRARTTRSATATSPIAAITSCTNTSNPTVLVAAGLLARNANRLGLKQQPWVKTSLAPGSQVVGEYLANSGLQDELDMLGFNLVGFGCTTCIGNSGPLDKEISDVINDHGGHRGGRVERQPQLRGAASAQTCRPTTSPRPRSSSPTRWPARCAAT